jgi:hypothetical protein
LRWLGTDGMQWVGAPFIHVHRVRLTCSYGGDGTGRRLNTVVHGVHARSGRSEAVAAWELREGNTREVLSLRQW